MKKREELSKEKALELLLQCVELLWWMGDSRDSAIEVVNFIVRECKRVLKEESDGEES